MADDPRPIFHDEPRFAANEPFSIATVCAEHDAPWFNQTLVSANDSVLRFATIHGEFHHHSHETDEVFYVLSGEMEVDIEGRTVTLCAGEGLAISPGTVHRTRANEPVQLLVIAAKNASMNGVGERN